MSNNFEDMDTEEEGKKDMGDVYDNFAEAFSGSDKLPSWEFVGKPTLERLLKEHFNSSDKFLDLGSASARVEVDLLLPNGVPSENITGIEISPKQVEIAKQRVPGADFRVGDITKLELDPESFDVALSHMVFEHLDDAGLSAVCKTTFEALKPGGEFIFVVTHPDKMTDLEGKLVTEDGPFTTTAPWGGELLNWKRSVERTREILEAAGFEIELTEDVKFPEPSEDLSEAEKEEYMKHYNYYNSKYPAMRLAVKAIKPKSS
ncbi:MAG: class I SAM-dependent methyltransferase [bacterium]|nr:class I SAM-dependent methyltransferase [bacterium]